MRYDDDVLKFAFELPDGWEVAPESRPPNAKFRSAAGTIEVLAATLGEWHQSADPFVRYHAMAAKGLLCSIDGSLGDETSNVISFRNNQRLQGLSVVRDGIHYEIA